MAVFASAARELRGYRLEMFSPQSPAYWIAKLFGGGFETAAGVAVTPEKALGSSTVFAAVRNVAEDLASLPLNTYTTVDGVRRVDRSSVAWRMLNVSPNPEMTAMSFREAVQGHALLRGNGYAEKAFDGAGRVAQLWPLNPARMRKVRNGQAGVSIAGVPAGQIAYLYTLPEGRVKVFAPDMVFHLRGFGGDGLVGYSIVALMREAIGLAIATEAYAGRFFANDARPGAVLSHPKTLSPKARENIELSWAEAHQGLDNAHRIAILEEGLSIEKVGIDPVDAQFIETQNLAREHLAAAFRMPPDKIGDLSRATFSNIEQSDINYAKYTLATWGRRWEQQLVADDAIDTDDVEHDLNRLYRGDAKSRAEFYSQLRASGGITANQIADAEGLPRSGDPAADQLLVPLAMTTLSALDANGMTLNQRCHAAWELMRAGYEAKGVNALLDLGDLPHTGMVPGTQTPDPEAKTS